jgi:hypothetical protein
MTAQSRLWETACRSASLTALAVAIAAVGAPRLGAQPSNPSTLRRATVTVTIENDRYYSGVYTASGMARICGKWTMSFPDRENAFTVEFPDDEPDLRVRSLSFDAKSLPGGSSTASFYLAVGVRVGERGAPPLYVVRANEPQYNEPGNATQATDKGVTTLNVTGTAALGVTVRAKVTCDPKT